MTPRLVALSDRFGVPLSTLKLNARILRDLELVSMEDHGVALTPSGREVVLLLREHVRRAPPVQEVKN